MAVRSDEKIKAALDSLTELVFVEAPLQEVLDHLKQVHKIEIQIDSKALEDVGIGGDSPVTADLKGVSLRSALQLMLKKLSLTYLISGGVLQITTPEEAEQRLETKVYPVADLVLPEGASPDTEADFDSLIDLITSTIKPTSWDGVGGPGSVTPFENRMSIVLSQTQDVHEEIEDLLAQLRSIKRQQGGNGSAAITRARKKAENANGGMMGGMGGMMGGPPPSRGAEWAAATLAARRRMPPLPLPAVTQPVAAPQQSPRDADLLQGVRGANQSNQSKQSGKLQDMYKKGSGGMGGVGAGGMF